ncbi:hypothetical protein IID10_16105 [candidate division KSB1 bacterium]|nr:hypothetical protein [candidate division KSB1 bacterium]
MFRLIFLGFLLYFAYKLLSGVFRFLTPTQKQKVKGKSKKPPLDLGNADVEDADFKDIE